jgi:hypothetical protein
MGEMKLDDETGRPLLVDPHAGPVAFYVAVDYQVGRYRLLAVDRRLRPIEDAEVPVVIITERMAQGARDRASRAGAVASPAAGGMEPPAQETSLVARLLGMFEETQRRHLSLLEESLRAHREHAALGISSTAAVVRAAGDAGMVERAAAAAKAVTSVVSAVAAPIGAPASPAPVVEPPSSPTSPAAQPARNAAVTPAAATSPTPAGSTATDDDDADEPPLTGALRWFDSLLSSPLGAHVAPIAAAKVAKAWDISVDDAKQFIDLGKEAIKLTSAAADVIAKPADSSTPSGTSAASTSNESAPTSAPIPEDEIDRRIAAIRNRLDANETQVLAALGVRHWTRLGEMKRCIGRLPVEQGVEIVRKVAAVWAQLDDAERSFVDVVIEHPSGGFERLLTLVGDHSVPHGVALLRESKKQTEAAQAAQAAADADA